ncbi:MAG: hypothetical protein ACRC3J_05285 [Culicoidibacterales bacterium]
MQETENFTLENLKKFNPKFDISTLPKCDKLLFPHASEWMWNYCVYLGTEEFEGELYDLGIYINDLNILSAAIVYGDEPGRYMSSWSTTNPLYIKLKEYIDKLGIDVRYLF